MATRTRTGPVRAAGYEPAAHPHPDRTTQTQWALRCSKRFARRPSRRMRSATGSDLKSRTSEWPNSRRRNSTRGVRFQSRATVQADIDWMSQRPTYQLRAAGLDAANIAACGLCTACHPSVFPSYRRDGAARSGWRVRHRRGGTSSPPDRRAGCVRCACRLARSLQAAGFFGDFLGRRLRRASFALQYRSSSSTTPLTFPPSPSAPAGTSHPSAA
jgi:hypothetical protein